MSENEKTGSGAGDAEAKGKSPDQLTREERLAKQLRENLARRKSQSRARNTKPRKFKT